MCVTKMSTFSRTGELPYLCNLLRTFDKNKCRRPWHLIVIEILIECKALWKEIKIMICVICFVEHLKEPSDECDLGGEVIAFFSPSSLRLRDA